MGIIDLDDDYEMEDRGGAITSQLLEGFDHWNQIRIDILACFGFQPLKITQKNAIDAYYDSVEYCRKKTWLVKMEGVDGCK